MATYVQVLVTLSIDRDEEVGDDFEELNASDAVESEDESQEVDDFVLPLDAKSTASAAALNAFERYNGNCFPSAMALAALYSHAQRINPGAKDALKRLNYISRTLSNNMQSAQAQNHTQYNREYLHKQFKELLRLLKQKRAAITQFKLTPQDRLIAPVEEIKPVKQKLVKQNLRNDLRNNLIKNLRNSFYADAMPAAKKSTAAAPSSAYHFRALSHQPNVVHHTIQQPRTHRSRRG